MSIPIVDRIKQLSKEFAPEMITHRRHLHMHPELSFEEKNTSTYICHILDQMGIEYKANIGGYGIVALINPGRQKTIALRGDMDALPIQETSDHIYRSQVKGVMHACGHDVHTTCLLGAAKVLNAMRDYIPHTIKLIFQPGEEKLPGGASLMIVDGVLEDPKPTAIIGQHVFPSLEVGKVGIRSGLYMASADEIYITVKGKGGHAAMPQDCIDSVLVAAQIIVALQSIVSRNANPNIPTVLSFGKINTVGGATNVIPDKVMIEGTFRTMDEMWRKKVFSLIHKLATDTASAYGATVDVDIQRGYPCLTNNPIVSTEVKSAMIEYLGVDNVVDLPIRMTSEDFAFFTQEIPGCFYRLGTGNEEKGINSPVHTSTFDIDEDSIEIGMGLMAFLAINDYLG